LKPRIRRWMRGFLFSLCFTTFIAFIFQNRFLFSLSVSFEIRSKIIKKMTFFYDFSTIFSNYFFNGSIYCFFSMIEFPKLTESRMSFFPIFPLWPVQILLLNKSSK